MGIILLLISILLPAIIRANRDATRAKMLADLMEISQGLEAYKQQFGDYPRSGPATPPGGQNNGSVILCWALLAPGPATTGNAPDGADGMGFRIRTASQGEVYGPYLRPDRFRVGTLTAGTNAVSVITPPAVYDDSQDVIGDMYGNVILYYPANPSVPPSQTYVGKYAIGTLPPQATFNYSDNSNVTDPTINPNANNTLTQHMFGHRLGDRPTPTPYDGKIGAERNCRGYGSLHSMVRWTRRVVRSEGRAKFRRKKRNQRR